jgi:hypothetical protein
MFGGEKGNGEKIGLAGGQEEASAQSRRVKFSTLFFFFLFWRQLVGLTVLAVRSATPYCDIEFNWRICAKNGPAHPGGSH